MKKLYKKLILGVSRLGESPGSVASESPKLLDELATGGFATGESPAESRKTLTPVF